MVLVAPVMAWLWVRGVRFLMENDPTVPGSPRWRDFWRAAHAELAPSAREILSAIPRFLAPGHHPSQEGSTQQALEYLAISPAARSYEDGHER